MDDWRERKEERERESLAGCLIVCCRVQLRATLSGIVSAPSCTLSRGEFGMWETGLQAVALYLADILNIRYCILLLLPLDPSPVSEAPVDGQ